MGRDKHLGVGTTRYSAEQEERKDRTAEVAKAPSATRRPAGPTATPTLISREAFHPFICALELRIKIAVCRGWQGV